MKLFIISLLIAFCGFKAHGQQTQKKYLSGTDKDHTKAWEFYCTDGRNCGEWSTIEVPSQWELQGFGNYNYSQTKLRSGEKGIYKYVFMVPNSWKGKSIRMHFEGVMTDATVRIDGQSAGPTHQGGFYPFSYEVSDLLNYGGKKNLLKVIVSKQSGNESVNKSERQSDYWDFGGIFRPVYLEAKPKQHIKRVAIDAKASGAFTSHIYTAGPISGGSLSAQIQTLSGRKIGNTITSKFSPQLSYQTLSGTFADAKPWSPEFPNMYKVKFMLKNAAGNVIHQTSQRFGFRTVELKKGDGFYVNGQKVRFKGSAYHSFWPSSGRTLSKKLIIKDVNLMKDMNMNALRATTYPHSKEFYQVCDSLGLFVMSELGGWHKPYKTSIGRKLVKETVVPYVNHPSIVMWSNGNHYSFNPDLEPLFYKWDIQNRRVLHNASKHEDLPKPANPKLPIIDTRYYPTEEVLNKRLNEKYPYLPMEALHALYDGGGAAGMQDYWNKIRSSRRGSGIIIWAYLDECVERTDKGGRLDCAGNRAPDGIVGPYRSKEGSFYALKDIWSPVKVDTDALSSGWDGRLSLENRYYFTNLSKVNFSWKLMDLPGPRDEPAESKTLASGKISSPNIAPQKSGKLKLTLPSGWKHADMLKLIATDSRGRTIYQWSLPIAHPQQSVYAAAKTNSSLNVQKHSDEFVLSSNHLEVHISKKTGYITKVISHGQQYSLDDGPAIASPNEKKDSLKSIAPKGKTLQAVFGRDDYRVRYSIDDGGLKLSYSYRPSGKTPYYGIQFDYPEKNVKSVKWVGHGPDRVWKNRLAGMELGFWRKKKTPPDSAQTSLSGYHWHNPYFTGYYAGLHWARLQTSEGPITVRSANHNIYLGLLIPRIPPKPRHTKFPYPDEDLSFLHGITPIGSKWQEAKLHGPSSQPNKYSGKEMTNTLWFYFGHKGY